MTNLNLREEFERIEFYAWECLQQSKEKSDDRGASSGQDMNYDDNSFSIFLRDVAIGTKV